MPINQVSVAGIMKPYMMSAGIAGPNSDQLIYAIAGGFADGVLLSTSVATMDVGTLGVGIGTGTVFLDSLLLFRNLADSFTGYGMAGTYSVPFANAIADGFSSAMGIGIVNTTSPSVGIGGGSGSVIPTSSLIHFLSAFSSAGLGTTHSIALASAISVALDLSLPSAVVTVALTGSPSPLVSSGIGTGFIT